MTELHASTQQVINALTQQGVVLPQYNPREISVPSDFSTIPDVGEGNIGELMGHIASYIQYLEYQAGVAETDYEAWNSACEFAKSQQLLILPDARRDIMEARVDTEVHQQKEIVMQKSMKLKLLKTVLEGQKRISDALSRELSRRNLIQQMRMRGLT